MNGLMKPDAGRILYDGRPIDAHSLKDPAFHLRFRRETTLLFQDPNAMLFHPTVLDEVAFGPRQLGQDDPVECARAWLDRIGIAHLAEASPISLSRGEMQKTALASLLVLEPRLLLLDEPTSSLDPRSTGWLVDFLQELPVTTVCATHNLSLASELGQRCLVLGEDHQLVFDGDPLALRDDHEVLHRANLVHIHSHRHRDGDREHRHYHTHDWD